MDVREKLVELLHKGVRCPGVIDNCNDCPHHSLEKPCDEFGATVDMLIANGVTVQEWISVKDRLPEKDVRVLVWMQDNEEYYTQIDTDRFSCTMEQGYHWIRWGKSVTHWMPLPQPPK